ncbi:MAG: hypothetical protein PHF31_15345 [Methylobacter sp.]|nr:hypothetical protein [Methylobacter sp.]
MISEQELAEKIEQVTKEFHGQLDDLTNAVGLIVVGRLMRLVASRKAWATAKHLFGDPKILLPEITEYSEKSLGYRIVMESGRYWDYVKGATSAMPLHEKRQIM